MKYKSTILITVLLSACASTGNEKKSCSTFSPPFQSLPSYSDMVRSGEKLISIVVEEDCGGIYGVKNIPDGWSYSAIAEGENYLITITPHPNNSDLNNLHGSPELSTTFRGEWSDCYNLTVIVNLEENQKPINRKFKQSNGFSGPWVEF